MAIPKTKPHSYKREKYKTMFGGFGGILIAFFLLLLGILLVTGILDFLLRIIGIAAIVLAVIVGAMAIFGNKDRY